MDWKLQDIIKMPTQFNSNIAGVLSKHVHVSIDDCETSTALAAVCECLYHQISRKFAQHWNLTPVRA